MDLIFDSSFVFLPILAYLVEDVIVLSFVVDFIFTHVILCFLLLFTQSLHILFCHSQFIQQGFIFLHQSHDFRLVFVLLINRFFLGFLQFRYEDFPFRYFFIG